MMKKMFILLILCSLLLGCATQRVEQIPTNVEKCYAPIWYDGDTWKFIGADRQSWEERIRIGQKLEVLQSPRKAFYGFCNIPFEGAKIFPLWVGKSVRGTIRLDTTKGSSMNYDYSFKVVEMTDLKVAAGVFKCYKIEFKLASAIAPGQGIGYIYYAPETRSVIKFEMRTLSSLFVALENYELLSFEFGRK